MTITQFQSRSQTHSTSQATSASEVVLDVQHLQTVFPTRDGHVHEVVDVGFTGERGKTLGISGESAFGKSVTARSILRAIEKPGKIASGSVRLFGNELLTLPEREMRQIHGRDIGMVFQDPGASLNPVREIGAQVMETYQTHRDASRSEARSVATDALASAGIEKPAEVMNLFPVGFSSGAKQRVMIAIAINDRGFFLCDNPVAALDVSLAAHVLNLVLDLHKQLGLSYVFVTNNLAVFRQIAQRIAVMRDGRFVELSAKEDIYDNPRDPYTRELLDAAPSLARNERKDEVLLAAS